jgi:hypothetical protein
MNGDLLERKTSITFCEIENNDSELHRLMPYLLLFAAFLYHKNLFRKKSNVVCTLYGQALLFAFTNQKPYIRIKVIGFFVSWHLYVCNIEPYNACH